jgi:hypothetical protein
MRFSEIADVDRTAEDDWFDPILSADTKLFVDPFLIYLDSDKFWVDSHTQLVSFFEEVLTLVAKAGSEQSNHWKAAQRLLLFPEPAEFCLGVGVRPLGHGTGDGLQAGMLLAARSTAKAVGTSVAHIEELSLFEEGIGADLISDIVCNILKFRFIEYTHSVADRHKLAQKPGGLTRVVVKHARWDKKHLVWHDETVELPVNPFTGRAVLLTPARFLRKHPTVDPVDFWDWAWVNRNRQIRGQFNYDLGRNVDADRIASFARQNPHLTQDYLSKLEQTTPEPYDVEADPDGEVTWYDAGANLAYAVAEPKLPETPDEFCRFVESMLATFAKYVETHREGWENLWIDARTPRKERHVQAALRTFLFLICRAADIDLSAEPNTGRGPVDFKFSQGFRRKALAEVKLIRATAYWHGLDSQTPAYMEAEDASCAFYVSVGFRSSDLTDSRKKLVEEKSQKLSHRLGVQITPIFVDARRKPSASKA